MRYIDRYRSSAGGGRGHSFVARLSRRSETIDRARRGGGGGGGFLENHRTAQNAQFATRTPRSSMRRITRFCMFWSLLSDFGNTLAGWVRMYQYSEACPVCHPPPCAPMSCIQSWVVFRLTIGYLSAGAQDIFIAGDHSKKRTKCVW